jgi:hypothetical protein
MVAKYAAYLVERIDYIFGKTKQFFYRTFIIPAHAFTLPIEIACYMSAKEKESCTGKREMYYPACLFYHYVNCAYTNVESVLADGTGGRCGFKVFDPFYDGVMEPARLKLQTVYIQRGAYLPGVIGGPNKRLFVLTFIRYC